MTAAMARLPLLGAWLLGKDLRAYEEPLAPVEPVVAPFSPVLFAIGLVIFSAIVLAFVVPLFRARGPASERVARRFPLWGWAGLALTGAAWIVAWTPSAPLRAFTFTPLWLGYVLVVAALAERRSGDSLLRHPRLFALTALSSVFWWFFEYLNRFVGSWSYHGVELRGPIDVVLYGVLPFATVLPAVIGTQDLLATSPWIDRAFAHGPPIALRHPRMIGAWTALAACLGLAALSWLPELLFPLLWLAPLFVITGLLAFGRAEHVFSDLARGDYRLVASSALAAVICGFFWEMWNYLSVARWTYAIPYVDAARIFEMPLLGYAGYVAFGWECASVAALIGFDGRRRF